jgi:endonuclease III
LRASLTDLLATLERHFGRPPPPRITDPWLMIVHENCAYLVEDARRGQVLRSLKELIGLKPADLLKADPRRITDAIKDGGMQPDRRARKLIDAAEIAEELGGDLGPVLGWPEPKARKALKRFPGIGEPGADKIFLFSRTHPILALDSNGLRALVRLGFGTESSNYATMYRSVQAAAAADLPRRFDTLIRAHHLLREHGRTLCRRTDPDCLACPLRTTCPFAGSSPDGRGPAHLKRSAHPPLD